jgi:hypothetical protein
LLKTGSSHLAVLAVARVVSQEVAKVVVHHELLVKSQSSTQRLSVFVA